MSFERLPDGMVGYATYELAELLGQLKPRQIAAIDRIVAHVYIANRPWAELFRGDNKICTEANYYKRGKADEETGEFSGVGWAHDKPFQDALEAARRLALATQERERMGRLQLAKRYAEQAAGPAVQTWVNVMAFGIDDAARIKAAQAVIDLAFKGSGDATDTGAGLEADWWAAGDDDEPS